MPRNRRSMNQPTPRAGDFELLKTVRERTYRMLKSTINAISKMDNETNVSMLSVMKDELDTKWSDFNNAFEENEAALVGAGELNEITSITNDYISVNQEFLKAKTHIRTLMIMLNEDIESTTNHLTPNEPITRSNFKLAPMRISNFSGNLSEWIEFKATCQAVLTDSMPDIQRLQHLKDALLGEARSLVSHILPGEGAYDSAMALLKDRYENTRAIINGHLQKFYSLPYNELSTAGIFRDMLNTVNGLIAALGCCGIDTSSWDSILIFHLTQRFDKTTLETWENKLSDSRNVPKLKTLLTFLESRITVAETTDTFFTANKQTDKLPKYNKSLPNQHTNQRSLFDSKKTTDKHKSFFTLKPTYRCVLCNKNHLASRCTEILNMSIKDRHSVITKNKLCINCFYPHDASECPFESACKKCSDSHHTLLHSDGNQVYLNITETATSTEKETDEKEEDNSDTMSIASAQHFYHINDETDYDTLLATAVVPTRHTNRSALLKSLIDQGSTANLITIRACHLLKLKFIRHKTPMFGVGDAPVGNVIGRTAFEIGSIHNKEYNLSVKAIVVQSIGDIKGFSKDNKQNWSHLRDLKLADPEYYKPSKIDMLLGGSVHADIILNGVIKGEKNQPIAQCTQLGWIISGNIDIANKNFLICRHITVEEITSDEDNVSELLKAFWVLEEPNYKHIPTNEEKLAEEIFQKSINRANDGKFIVDLPFKVNPYECLGDSYKNALKRYYQLQQKFSKNPQLKMQYDAILEEYLTLKHMELVTDKPDFQCFLPHHYVIKESSTTTKMRIVFDASAKTYTGTSLNECLCVGPVIQTDLIDLLMGWRKFEFAVSADIEKMYRMMYVSREHVNFHTILWHRPGTKGIAMYRLLTVTFGTSSAPFQATRGIHEVGERIKHLDANLAKIIQKCFYVDDFLKSFSTIDSACNTNLKLIKTLNEYGFKLRKWKSNDHRALDGINEIDKEESIDFESTFKTLGIAWHAKTDSFVFKTLNIEKTPKWTKRKLLSAIAKLFDPLGWLAPCIVRAKMLMQSIWQLPSGINWDDELPEHILKQWTPIFDELTSPVPISVPRWLKLSENKDNVELHAFCDASNLAYACCVYLRVIHEDQTVSCNLVTAKTKVAPVRITTIPRLELCGAILLSQLVSRCVQALSIDKIRIVAWCDSKIVLAWIATHPSKWTPFVANRVSDIQHTIDSSHWRYISSKQNPADIASRGQSINEIKTSSIWWHGPSFLSSNGEIAPDQIQKLPIDTAPEKRKNIKVFHIIEPKQNDLLIKFENYNRLLYFTCMALRWLNRIQQKHTNVSGPITATEMQTAENRWILLIQLHHFGYEIHRLKNKGDLPKNSILIKLTPFVDEKGYLRMNGRVGNAELLQQKTSIILPSNSRFTMLIIRQVHQEQALHGGVQLTLRTLRERFWIIHARNQVSKVVNNCMVCYRTKKRLLKQRMADLPSFRTEQAKPFTFVGVDYAGPFNIKTGSLRNSPLMKGHIALFICLTTKAIHLELACDESTEEFIMVLENFIARRRIPSVIYSDNGRNFVGAENEIHRLYDQMLSQTNNLTRMLANKRITFKRLPARASHMAGIWERAVGMVKYHIKRVMKDTKLTSRQFEHVLKQIECCLNSRPLWAHTPNADDIEIVTPSHFWNFEPSNTLPQPDISHIRLNQLSQYQHLYRLYCEFWKYWSKEYLDQFQPREKWNDEKPNIKVGHIVVVSEDNLPPSKWSIGKVTALYPGSDGLVRVVDVKIGNSIKRRPIHRLGMLPILDNEKLSSSDDMQLNAGE